MGERSDAMSASKRRSFLMSAEESRRNLNNCREKDSPSKQRVLTQGLLKKASDSSGEQDEDLQKKLGNHHVLAIKNRILGIAKKPDLASTGLMPEVGVVEFEDRLIKTVTLRSVYVEGKLLESPGSREAPELSLLKSPIELSLNFRGQLGVLLMSVSTVLSFTVHSDSRYTISIPSDKLLERFKQELVASLPASKVDVTLNVASAFGAEFLSYLKKTAFRYALKTPSRDCIIVKKPTSSIPTVFDSLNRAKFRSLPVTPQRAAAGNLSVDDCPDDEISAVLSAKRKAASDLSQSYVKRELDLANKRYTESSSETPRQQKTPPSVTLLAKRSTSPYFAASSPAEGLSRGGRSRLQALPNSKSLLELELQHVIKKNGHAVRETICLDDDDDLNSEEFSNPRSGATLQVEDKVVLRYSSKSRGEIAITEMDTARLAEDVYLNDTLIDFYLAYILDNLAASNLLASTYLFSTFFYSQYTSKRGLEGYETVEKWTRDIDLFSKKFVVVPIHEAMHWYVIVIYNPGALVGESQPYKIRNTTVKDLESLDTAYHDFIESRRARFRSRASLSVVASPTPSLVERGQRLAASKARASSVLLADDSDSSDGDFSIPSSNFYQASLPSTLKDLSEGLCTAGKGDSQCVSFSQSGAAKAPDSEGAVLLGEEPPLQSSSDSVKKDNQSLYKSFYCPERKYWNGKKLSDLTMDERRDMQEQFAKRINSATKEANGDKCYMFVFDSLGNTHPTAVRLLNEYLRCEATVKGKSTVSWSNAVASYAKVPLQPNSWDCGVYVLQTIESLFSDPDKYLTILLNKFNVPNAWYSRETVSRKRCELKKLIHTFGKVA